MSAENVRLGDAAAIVAKESPEAATLMVNLMERSAHENQDLLSQLYEGEVAAHERTRERLRAAEARLALIEHRAAFGLGLVHTPFPEVFA